VGLNVGAGVGLIGTGVGFNVRAGVGLNIGARVGANVDLLITEETRKNNKDATPLAENVYNSEQRPLNFLLRRGLGGSLRRGKSGCQRRTVDYGRNKKKQQGCNAVSRVCFQLGTKAAQFLTLSGAWDPSFGQEWVPASDS
jgi:hypothetical protein